MYRPKSQSNSSALSPASLYSKNRQISLVLSNSCPPSNNKNSPHPTSTCLLTCCSKISSTYAVKSRPATTAKAYWMNSKKDTARLIILCSNHTSWMKKNFLIISIHMAWFSGILASMNKSARGWLRNTFLTVRNLESSFHGSRYLSNSPPLLSNFTSSTHRMSNGSFLRGPSSSSKLAITLLAP